jgi:hypothetical protein
MTPVNNKSMISFLFGQMEKLDSGEITTEQAKEQSNLAKQVNSAMKYEIDRARVKMDLAKHNAIYKDGADLRDIESKNF